MSVSLRWDLPPARALEFFRSKGLASSFAWQDMLHQEHDAAFTVAKMLDVDLLRDVRSAVDRAIAEGQTFREFRQGIEPLLVERGWWGRAEMVDPVTGELEEVQLGSPRRLRTIFRTNLRTAYAAGHWQRITDHAAQAPYLLYDAVLDARTRPDHREWDGTVLRWDDPWWQTHYPPNGWNCRCTIVQLNERQLRRLGRSAPDRAPDNGEREWVNPRTGEIMRVPRGIDPGWAYHPGRSRVENLGRQFADKATAAGPELGSAAAQAVERARPPVILSRRDQVFSSARQITQETVERALEQVPGAQPQLEKLRRFIDAHPQKVLFLRASETQRGSAAAARIEDAVTAFLGASGRRLGRNAYAPRGVARAQGFTSASYEHVVVKVKAGDRLDELDASALARGVEDAIEVRSESRWRWSIPEAAEKAAGERGVPARILGVLIHELGHQVHFWAGKPGRPFRSEALTRYSMTNVYEWHAEHFTAWLLNREALARWEPDIAEYFDELIERATLGTEKRG